MDIGVIWISGNTDTEAMRTPTPYCQRKLITDTLKYQPIGMVSEQYGYRRNMDIEAIRISRQYGYRCNTDTDPYCQRKFITDTLKYQPIGMDIGAIRISKQYGYRRNTDTEAMQISGNADIATVYVSLSRRALYGIVARIRNSCTDTEQLCGYGTVVRNSCAKRGINSTCYSLRDVVALLPVKH